MDEADFVDRVFRRAGCRHAREARLVSEATLEALGEVLEPPLRREVAERLPTTLAEALTRRSHSGPVSLIDLVERICEIETTRPGFGKEHAEVVLAVLGVAVGPDLRERLSRHLPDDYGAQLRDERLPGVRPAGHQVHEPHRQRRTLAEGRPGPRRPINEWKP